MRDSCARHLTCAAARDRSGLYDDLLAATAALICVQVPGLGVASADAVRNDGPRTLCVLQGSHHCRGRFAPAPDHSLCRHLKKQLCV